MSEVYFEVRVTDKGGTEIHSCGTLEEIYDIVAGAVIGSTQAVQKQLGRGDEFSAAGVNMFMSKLMHYAQRDMTNTRCSIVLPMGFKKGGDERGKQMLGKYSYRCRLQAERDLRQAHFAQSKVRRLPAGRAMPL